jgi:hypothetical protein
MMAGIKLPFKTMAERVATTTGIVRLSWSRRGRNPRRIPCTATIRIMVTNRLDPKVNKFRTNIIISNAFSKSFIITSTTTESWNHTATRL